MSEPQAQTTENQAIQKMDPELKAKWLEALRGGKHKQATQALHDTTCNGFCCLGVLCDVVNPNGWDSAIWSNDWQDDGSGYCDGDLDKKMLRRTGITDSAQRALIKMNDDEGKTFPEIADWIEANL